MPPSSPCPPSPTPKSAARCSKPASTFWSKSPSRPRSPKPTAWSTPPSANGRILQVGHLERFNPAVIALEKRATLPLFFEIHRMSVFTLRSLDVDVVLDLMIHDLDIVLALARAPSQGDPRRGHFHPVAQSRYRQRAARIRRRLHRQSDRQPRLHRKGAKAAPFPAAASTFRSIMRSSPLPFLRSAGRRESPSSNCRSNCRRAAEAAIRRLSGCCRKPPTAETEWPYGA